MPTSGSAVRAEVYEFTLRLSCLMRSGVSILDALEACAKTTRDLKLQEVLLMVRAKVSEGESLAKPFRVHPEYFDPLFVQLVAVGEETGKLDQMLQKICESMEQEDSASPQYRVAVALAAMIEADILLIPSVSILAEQADDPNEAAALRQIAAKLSEGESLSDALAVHSGNFDPFFIQMVLVGESGGNMAEQLTRPANTLGRMAAQAKKSGG